MINDGRMELTYPDVGGTRPDQAMPAGYRHVRRRLFIGTGGSDFAAAREALADWRMFRAAGLVTRSANARAELGARFANGLGQGPLRLWVPCLIVWLVDEPRRYGYGFGTLPGHPESGEEAVELSLDERDEVWFEVRAFSRPVAWYARLGGPVTRALQDWMTGRYLNALRRLVNPD